MKIVLRGKNGNTMRKTIIIITICGWLLAGGAVAVAGAGEVHVFNAMFSITGPWAMTRRTTSKRLRHASRQWSRPEEGGCICRLACIAAE